MNANEVALQTIYGCFIKEEFERSKQKKEKAADL